MVASATSVAQLSHGDTAAKAAGTGVAHSRPMTARTIAGTQIQCRSLLVGCWWLTEYSPSQSFTVRI